MTEASTFVELADLRVSLADRSGSNIDLVHDVSFVAMKGSLTAIIGESGSGKSVTCLSLLGLQPQEAEVSGRLRVDGRDVPLASEGLGRLRGRRITMIFQDPMAALNPVRRIGAQLFETVRLRSPELSRQDARGRVLSLLSEVGLEPAEQFLPRAPHHLSGGQAQRVMIALALACKPDLLLADEPTTALDPQTAEEILALLQELRRERGLTIVIVSHDLGLVLRHADYVYVLQDGRVVEEGAPAKLASAARHPHTLALLEAVAS